MSDKYCVMTVSSNLKTDDDRLQYLVESVDGGGIVYTGNSLEAAEDYTKSIGGTLEYVI